MRNIVLKEDRDLILKMYDEGKSMTKIAALLDYSHYTVKSIIKTNTGSYTETKITKRLDWSGKTFEEKEAAKKKKTEKDPNRIINLYKLGHSISDIVYTERDVTVSEVKRILNKAGLLELTQVDKEILEISEREESKMVTVKNINEFKKTVKQGDIFIIKKDKLNSIGREIKIKERVVVENTYPNFVKTDKGSFQYYDLFVGEKVN